MTWWITLDEPTVVLVAGYLSRDFPPGLGTLSLTSPTLSFHQTAVDVMKRMIDAHAQTYGAIKAIRPDARVGFVQNLGKLVEILAAVHEAMAAGAHVRGYCCWTLVHDYEWNNAWEENMGLYSLPGLGAGTPGPDTDFTRVPERPFTDVYRQVTQANGLSQALLHEWAPALAK